MTVDTDRAVELRHKLVDELAEWAPFHVAGVEEAMRAVLRHAFLPDVPVEEAYSHGNVVTHRDRDGVAISSASAAGLVADMLQQLQVAPGHRVLEIGAGTGYNAAVLAHLAGPGGQVSTIDIDPDVCAAARAHLAAQGWGNVRVIRGDGTYGDAAGAPFDRIIVTAGAWTIPQAWFDQLAPAGRIVVPLRLRGITRSVALEHNGSCWQSRSVHNCGFIPMRGAEHRPEGNLALNAAGTLILRVDNDQPVDADALRRALTSEPEVLWTGVIATAEEKGTGFADLDYWLAAPRGLCRLLTRSPDHGLIAPALAYGSMALLDGATLAYLTTRPGGAAGTYEVGVCAYGPEAEKLANLAGEQVLAWDTGRRLHTRIEVYPTGTPDPTLGPETLLVEDKPHAKVIVRTLPPQP